MLIFLIGFMGSGKSTIGLEVANALDIGFWDMDELIQDQQAMRITEIFREHGQGYFRELERDMIRGFSDHLEGDAVISAGGGAPCFFDNIDQLNKQGTTVYLQLTPDKLFNRLKNEADGRPLLADKSDDEMLDLIHKMYDHRASYYEQAVYTVDADRSPKEIVEHILYLLNE